MSDPVSIMPPASRRASTREVRGALDQPEAALSDPLTGLATPALFQDRLRYVFAWRDAPNLAVLALCPSAAAASPFDWDEEQRSVRAVAREIEQGLRGGDTAAYLGAGRFEVLLLDIASALDAARVAQRLIDRVESAHPAVAATGRLQLAVGVACSRACSPRPTADLLLDEADEALAQAQRLGPARFHVLPAHDHAARPEAGSA